MSQAERILYNEKIKPVALSIAKLYLADDIIGIN